MSEDATIQPDAADPRRWGWRRTAVFLCLAASFSIVFLAVERDVSGAAAVAAVTGLIGLITVVVLAYVFAPTLEAGWDVVRLFAPRRKDD
jgi:hypothetical protein